MRYLPHFTPGYDNMCRGWWVCGGILLLALTGCGATKNKCFDINMKTDASRVGIELTDRVRLDLEGQNHYRSCPGEHDPTWLKEGGEHG